MDRALVWALRARAVDVKTALDERMLERSDEEHLEYATAEGRVLLTCNIADFCGLHAEYGRQGKPHAGIILMRQQRNRLGITVRRLLRLVQTESAEEMENRVEFLSVWKPA